MPPSNLINARNCALLIVDVQSRLVPAIHNADDVIQGCTWLIDVARDLDVPVLMTEQNPGGLGETIPELRERTEAHERFSKMHFSCVSEHGFLERLNDLGVRQIVVAGMEAHVCVMQTVLELLDNDYQVHIVGEVLGTRNRSDLDAATDRMCAAGAVSISQEMLFFEWLHNASHPNFSQLLRRHITGAGGLDSRR